MNPWRSVRGAIATGFVAAIDRVVPLPPAAVPVAHSLGS
jgi:hypothetical protein